MIKTICRDEVLLSETVREALGFWEFSGRRMICWRTHLMSSETLKRKWYVIPEFYCLTWWIWGEKWTIYFEYSEWLIWGYILPVSHACPLIHCPNPRAICTPSFCVLLVGLFYGKSHFISLLLPFFKWLILQDFIAVFPTSCESSKGQKVSAKVTNSFFAFLLHLFDNFLSSVWFMIVLLLFIF